MTKAQDEYGKTKGERREERREKEHKRQDQGKRVKLLQQIIIQKSKKAAKNG